MCVVSPLINTHKTPMRKWRLRELGTLPMDAVCRRWGWELELVFEALSDSKELAVFDTWNFPFARSPLRWFSWKSLSHQVINSLSLLGIIILKGYLFTKLPLLGLRWQSYLFKVANVCIVVPGAVCVCGPVSVGRGPAFQTGSDTTEPGRGGAHLASSKGGCVLWPWAALKT